MSVAPRQLFSNLLFAAALTAAGFAGRALWQRVDAMQATLSQVLAEVTRMRIEQRSTSKGPIGLLEKLRVYAPMLANSRVTEPDFQSAKREMDDILLAFGSLGADALQPITRRLEKTDPEKDFEEVRFLLEALLRVDPKIGKETLKEVLQGTRLPSPKLRWFAAQKMIEVDKQLAQALLRQIVTTESSRGVNPDRSAAGAPIPDAAALATTGFHNFIIWYARTEDPATDDTLLMVMQRAIHDRQTIQECIKVLGEHHCQAAVKPIEELYQNPPLQQQDPLFLSHCLNALVDIEGKAARPFLEQQLPLATSDATAKLIQFLLDKISK